MQIKEEVPQTVSFNSTTRTSTTEESDQVSFAINGLPSAESHLVGGGTYALKCRTPSARFRLFAGMLQHVLASNKRVTLVTAMNPEDFISRLQEYTRSDLAALLRSGVVNLLTMQSEFSKKVFRYGADRVIAELERVGFVENSFLLFDQADDLVSLHDLSLALKEVQVLSRWFAANQVTTLLSFSRPTDRQSDTFNGLMDHFNGIARFGGDNDGLELNFLYWRSQFGIAIAQSYRLTDSPTGFYEARPNIQAVVASGSPIVDRRVTRASSAPFASGRFDSEKDLVPLTKADSEPTAVTGSGARFYVLESKFLELASWFTDGFSQLASFLDFEQELKVRVHPVLIISWQQILNRDDAINKIYQWRALYGTSWSIVIISNQDGPSPDILRRLISAGVNGVIVELETMAMTASAIEQVMDGDYFWEPDPRIEAELVAQWHSERHVERPVSNVTEASNETRVVLTKENVVKIESSTNSAGRPRARRSTLSQA